MDDRELRRILESTRRVAVLGMHDAPIKAAFYVPEYLHRVGYEVYGVNPKLAGRRMFSHEVVATLAELPEAVDMIDVFRRSELLPGHLDEILAMAVRPAVVWLQLGVRNDRVAQRLRAEGIEVVQDRCTLADHQRLGLRARSAP